MNSLKFNFPEYFQWPFFFSIQKHAETRLKQLTMWKDLILSYCQTMKIWRLSKIQMLKYLGSNEKINRKLNSDAVDLIFEYLVEYGKGIYTNQINKEEVFILWKSIEGWKDFLYDSAFKHHRIEQIETLDYIVSDDDNREEEYYGMDKDLLIIILIQLEKKGKCVLLTDSNDKYVGVKFK
jgi:ESCRT-II complex subunit VPS25